MTFPFRTTVELTEDEIDRARAVGAARLESQRGRHDARADPSRSSLAINHEGAIGEMAFAKFTGLDWDGAFKPIAEWLVWRNTGADVSGFEVKTSRNPRSGLLLRKHHRPDRVYVLVILDVGRGSARFPGWAYGHEVKRDEHWDEHKPVPCFDLPQDHLHSIDTLQIKHREKI